MKEKLLRLMAGRNGNDELNRFLLFADAFVLLLAMIFSRTLGRFLMPLRFESGNAELFFRLNS